MVLLRPAPNHSVEIMKSEKTRVWDKLYYVSLGCWLGSIISLGSSAAHFWTISLSGLACAFTYFLGVLAKRAEPLD